MNTRGLTTTILILLVSLSLITATVAVTRNEALAMSHVQMIAPNDKTTVGVKAEATTTTASTVREMEKCNNVMLLVKVKDIPDSLITLTLTANLDGRNVVKAINIKDQNILDLAAADKGSITVPLSFKKIEGCKSGDQFAGSVNDVIPFIGKLDNPKKPTKISVSLSELSK